MPRNLGRYGGAVLVVAACTAVAVLMSRRFELANLTMVYLLGVVVAAVAFGRGPAVLSAVLGVATFDFAFVPPRGTFEVEDAQYLVTFAVMLVVAVVIGSLTARLREELGEARHRERRTSTLYGLSRDLAAHSDADELVAIAARRVAEVLGAEVAVLLADDRGDLTPAAQGNSLAISEEIREDARRAWENGQITGLEQWNTEPHVVHLPLEAGFHRHGVMSARPLDGSWEPERLQLFRALAAHAALALERARLAEHAEKSRVEAETERTRNALLSSVSHDLRTPLAAILGAATVLRDQGESLPGASRRDLADTIAGETQALDRLVANLLDATRLQSGAVTPQREWHSLQEIVGVVLGRLESTLGARPVRVDVPEGLPLVSIDGPMIGQLLTNLVENAARHGTADSPIEVSARVQDGELELVVADRGPGLAPGEETRIFEKFQRGAGHESRPGAGLGLTISRGIAEAHGGTIRAEARPGGGARFVVTIPVRGTAPPIAGEEGVA